MRRTPKWIFKHRLVHAQYIRANVLKYDWLGRLLWAESELALERHLREYEEYIKSQNT